MVFSRNHLRMSLHSKMTFQRTVLECVSQPISQRDDEDKTDKPKRSSLREKTSGVAINVYSRKTLEKPKEVNEF